MKVRMIILVALLVSACVSAPPTPTETDCDIRFLWVTPDEFVWVEANAESTITQREAIARLESSTEHQRLSQGRCVDDGRSPIIWTYSQDDSEAAKTRAESRAIEVWRAASRSRELPEPRHRFKYGSRHRPPQIYRSRAELDENSPAVGDDFDFSKKWLVRAEVPGSEWREVCEPALDAYMSESETEPEETEMPEVAPAARIVSLPYRYSSDGELVVVTPRRPERLNHETGCRELRTAEPVLVAIPRTNLDWVVVPTED